MLGARIAVAVLAGFLAASTVGGLADAMPGEDASLPETRGGGDSLASRPPVSPNIDILEAGHPAFLEATVTIATQPAGLDVIVNGTRSPSPVAFTAPPGATVTIGAPSPQPVRPDTRYAWLSWSDGGEATHLITVGGSATLLAIFRIEYYLTVDSPVPGSSGNGWYVSGTRAYAYAAYTFLDVAPGERLAFFGWGGDAAGTGTTSGPILMDRPKIAVAEYGRQFFLQVETPYGTGVGSRWHNAGTRVAVLVTPSRVDVGAGTRQVFAGWSGDASGSTALSDPILMDGPKRAVATWRPEYLVTLDSQFPGVQGEGWYAAGSVATLQAPPQVTSGPYVYMFAGWTGDIVSSDPTVTVLVDRPLAVTATWTLPGAFGPFLSILVAAGAAVAAVIVIFWMRRRRSRRPGGEGSGR